MVIPTILNDESSLTTRERDKFVFQINAVDPDGDTLTYELEDEPSGMTISTTGKIEWKTTADTIEKDEESYQITVNVKDAYITKSYTFTLILTKFNRLPVVTRPSIDDSKE